MQEVPIRSLGWEDSPGKEMATHSSILAWRIPWSEEPGGLQSMGSQLDTTERLHFHFSLSDFFGVDIVAIHRGRNGSEGSSDWDKFSL